MDDELMTVPVPLPDATEPSTGELHPDDLKKLSTFAWYMATSRHCAARMD